MSRIRPISESVVVILLCIFFSNAYAFERPKTTTCRNKGFGVECKTVEEEPTKFGNKKWCSYNPNGIIQLNCAMDKKSECSNSLITIAGKGRCVRNPDFDDEDE